MVAAFGAGCRRAGAELFEDVGAVRGEGRFADRPLPRTGAWSPHGDRETQAISYPT
jgi:hypothetical protein